MTREAAIAERVARQMNGAGLDAEGITEGINSLRKSLDGLNTSVWFEGEDARFLISRAIVWIEDRVGTEDTLDEESLRSELDIVRMLDEVRDFEREVTRANRKAKEMFAAIRNMGGELERKARLLSSKCEKIERELPR